MGSHLEKTLSRFDPQNPAAWHNRFVLQARWSEQARRYLYTRLEIRRARRVLEVGCGTGAITSGLPRFTRSRVHGLDIRPDFLQFARSEASLHYTCGDALALPYPAGVFDFTLCHFLLLWLTDPAQGLAEMRRVTRRGGYVLALAEPDYGGRIDYPDELAGLGRLQTAALGRQGADPYLGRKAAALFRAAGLQFIQVGLLGGQWSAPLPHEAWESEWAMIEADLGNTVAGAELQSLRRLDAAAWQNGERILYVPTFYAWGQAA